MHLLEVQGKGILWQTFCRERPEFFDSVTPRDRVRIKRSWKWLENNSKPVDRRAAYANAIKGKQDATKT